MSPMIERKRKILEFLLSKNYSSTFFVSRPPVKMNQDTLEKIIQLLDMDYFDLCEENLSAKLQKNITLHERDEIQKILGIIKISIHSFLDSDVFNIDDLKSINIFYLSTIHIMNQDKMKDNVSAYTGKAFFTPGIRVPSRNFINKIILNNEKTNKIIYKFLYDLEKFGKVPVDYMLPSLSPTTHGFINMLEELDFGMQKLVTEIDNSLKLRNTIKNNLPYLSEEDINELEKTSGPVTIYDSKHLIQKEYSPLFLISMLYFTKLKNIPNVSIPMSILDCYYFSEYQEKELLFALNTLTEAEFKLFITAGLYFMNLKDLECTKEARSSMYRALKPLRRKIKHWTTLTSCSSLTEEYKESTGMIKAARRGVRKSILPPRIETLVAASENKGKNRSKVTSNIGKFNRINTLLGEYAQFCAKNSIKMNDGVFKKLLDGKITLKGLLNLNDR